MSANLTSNIDKGLYSMTKRSLSQKYKAVFILEKSINVIYHINRLKNKNTSSLSDSEKALTKSNTNS